MDPSVFPRRDPDAQKVLSLEHDAVISQIDPAFVRVARDGRPGGSQIAAAIELVPERRGKDREVDVAVDHDVFEDRAAAHFDGRYPRERADLSAPGLDQSSFICIRRELERQCQAARRVVHPGEEPKVWRMIRNLLEAEGGRLGLFEADDLRQGADLKVPVRAANAPKLAQRRDAVEPFSEIFIAHDITILAPYSNENI